MLRRRFTDPLLLLDCLFERSVCVCFPAISVCVWFSCKQYETKSRTTIYRSKTSHADLIESGWCTVKGQVGSEHKCLQNVLLRESVQVKYNCGETSTKLTHQEQCHGCWSLICPSWVCWGLISTVLLRFYPLAQPDFKDLNCNNKEKAHNLFILI